MELDARGGATLDGGDDRGLVLDLGDDDAVGRLAGKGVGEIDVLAVEAVEERRRGGHPERVPAHVWDTSGPEPSHRPTQHAETASTLLAFLEEELHAQADAEHWPPGGDALAQDVRKAVGLQPSGCALRIADAGNHGELRLANGGRVTGHFTVPQKKGG